MENLQLELIFYGGFGYGESFGLAQPVILDLSIITLTLGIQFKINIASIIGIAIALFIYRKT